MYNKVVINYNALVYDLQVINNFSFKIICKLHVHNLN